MQEWRKHQVRKLLRASIFLGFVALVEAVLDDTTRRSGQTALLYVFAYAPLILLAFRPGVPYWVQTGVILLILYWLGTVEVLKYGIKRDCARIYPRAVWATLS
jgi:hypothetical protein